MTELILRAGDTANILARDDRADSIAAPDFPEGEDRRPRMED
jgi:hypothetical protein